MTTNTSTRRFVLSATFAAALFAWGNASAAQPESAQPQTLVLPTPEKLLREAYARTQGAPREAELTEVIRMCRQARQARPAASVAAYADELAAWAHNRRGELCAEQAAELDRPDEQTQAAELDRRALADFENAIKLDPRNWKPLHNRAVNRALAGNWEPALEDFRRVLELKPDHASAWFNRGEIRAARGQYELAVADYTQAVALRSDDREAYRRRGQAYVRLGQLREALVDFDHVVRLASGQAEPLLDRGDAHRSLGQWSQAAEDYRLAMTIDSDCGRAYRSAAWFLATCPEERYRDAELAVQAAEKALELDGPRDVNYLDTAAAAYANRGQYDKACEVLGRAIDASPDQAGPLRHRLALYQRQRPYRETQAKETASPAR